MTPDSLEAAIVHSLLGELSLERHRAEEVTLIVAAAAREWMRKLLIDPNVLALTMCLGDPGVCLLGDTATIPCRGHRNAAGHVMADVALRLGLEP